MINQRKLDDLITFAPFHMERECGYLDDYTTVEEMEKGIEPDEATIKHRVAHVDGLVAMVLEERLIDYLYEECYYENLEVVKANVNYVNETVRKDGQLLGWKDIELQAVLKSIEEKEQRKREEDEEDDSVWDTLLNED